MEEAEQLDAEADAVEEARIAGVSKWGSELPPPFLQQLLEVLEWEPAVCGAIRATCSTWGAMHDALCRTLQPWSSAAVMEGKWGWFQSVTEVDLTECEPSMSVVQLNLHWVRSLPSLHTLHLPVSCAESAVEAEALYGVTTLTTLCFCETRDTDEHGDLAEEDERAWELDLSRLTTLTELHLESCPSVTDEQVRSVSNLAGLTFLNLGNCQNQTGSGLGSSLASLTKLNLHGIEEITAAGMRAVSSLPALTHLNLNHCSNVEELREVGNLTGLTDLNLNFYFNTANATDEVMHAVSGISALTSLDLTACRNITSEALCEVGNLTALTKLNLFYSHSNVTNELLVVVSSLTALTYLNLANCYQITDHGLRRLTSLHALTSLYLFNCDDVTAAGKQALRAALPSLTIYDGL